MFFIYNYILLVEALVGNTGSSRPPNAAGLTGVLGWMFVGPTTHARHPDIDIPNTNSGGTEKLYPNI